MLPLPRLETPAQPLKSWFIQKKVLAGLAAPGGSSVPVATDDGAQGFAAGEYFPHPICIPVELDH